MREFVAQCTAMLQTPEIRQELKRLVSPILTAVFEDLFPIIYFVVGLLLLNTVSTIVLAAYAIVLIYRIAPPPPGAPPPPATTPAPKETGAR